MQDMWASRTLSFRLEFFFCLSSQTAHHYSLYLTTGFTLVVPKATLPQMSILSISVSARCQDTCENFICNSSGRRFKSSQAVIVEYSPYPSARQVHCIKADSSVFQFGQGFEKNGISPE